MVLLLGVLNHGVISAISPNRLAPIPARRDRGPLGGFYLRSGDQQALLLLGGGGIWPLRAMLLPKAPCVWASVADRGIPPLFPQRPPAVSMVAAIIPAQSRGSAGGGYGVGTYRELAAQETPHGTSAVRDPRQGMYLSLATGMHAAGSDLCRLPTGFQQ